MAGTHRVCRWRQCAKGTVCVLGAVALLFGMRVFPPSFLWQKNEVKVFVPKDGQSCKYQAPFSVQGSLLTTICIYHPFTDTKISGHIRMSKVWEEDLVILMLDLMKKRSSLLGNSTENIPELCLVDVGSNIGVFTMAAAVSGYRVLAIDAMKSSLELLATSLRLANVESRVTILHNAILDRHQRVTMRVNPYNIGGSFIVRPGIEKAKVRGTLPRLGGVKAVCLDDVVPYVATSRVFVKMDIEQSEWLALQCADKFFAELEVLYLMMEWMLYVNNSRQGNIIINFMTSRGYRPFRTRNLSRPLSPAKNSTWPDNIIWIKQ